MGGFNVHGALLPRHRGANPIQWAIVNDERRAGVTLHRMTEEIDAGAIIAQREVRIEFGDSWREVQARISEATESLLAEQLPLLLSGVATATPQPQSTRGAHQPAENTRGRSHRVVEDVSSRSTTSSGRSCPRSPAPSTRLADARWSSTSSSRSPRWRH